MFSIDILGNLERLSIYLSRPSGELLTCLDEDIDENSASLTVGVNQQYELQFQINRSTDSSLVTWYDYIQEGMYLFVEKVGLFKMNQPSIDIDGVRETKSVIAHSCDVELEDKNCNLTLNMGTKTSMEYLVQYDEGEDEVLLNPYTNIPYDWLVLYNTFPEQLQIVLDKLKNNYYGIVNNDGTISTHDEDLVTELLSLFDTIPRLKNKLVADIDDRTGLTSYSLVEYVYFGCDYNSDKIIEVTLTPQFKDRVNELIEFYTKYRHQLSLLDLALDETNGVWSVGEIFGVSEGDFTLANKRYQFEANENIYSFLTQTLAQAIGCVINFDIINRRVNATPVEMIGNDTGITLSYDTLMNTMNISCDEDKLATRIRVLGSDDLGIEQVNFGSSTVVDLSYKMNARDSEGRRIYVSDELAEKYLAFVDKREDARDEYIQLTKDYSNYGAEISELKYRVPNDALSNDWSTYSLEDLNNALKNYKNLLAALITMYKDEYPNIGVNSDGSVNENYLKTTVYWHDYAAYQGIINEINCAIETFPFYDKQDEWPAYAVDKYKELITAWETDWSLFGTVELQAKIDSYKGNMDLLLEGNAVIPYVDSEEYTEYSWQYTSAIKDGDAISVTAFIFKNFDLINVGNSFFQTVYPISISRVSNNNIVIGFIEKGHSGKTIFGLNNPRYSSVIPAGTVFDINTCEVSLVSGSATIQPDIEMVLRQTTKRKRENEYDIKSWKELSASEKTEYGTEINYQYDVYMKFFRWYVSAKEYLVGLQTRIDELTELQNKAQSDRNDIVSSVQLNNNFTDDEVKIITLLLRDSEYTNDNILVTKINSSDNKIDIMRELLEDGKNNAAIISRPQLTFAIDSDNVLGLPEFEALWTDFMPGNYMLVQLKDDTFVKLRMVGYNFNPCIPTSNAFTITFSNQIRARAGVSDLENLLGLASPTSSSGGGGSSSGGSGDGYGESDDIDATISNTMLAKLLSSESFGTRVTNVILDTLDLNMLTAKFATFGGLGKGTTTIDGKCLQTGYIVDAAYDGVDGDIDNAHGSVINLETGLFNMGGGALRWDGESLGVKGAIQAQTLSAGRKRSATDNLNGLFIDADGNLYSGDNNETQIFSDGRFSFGNGNLSWNGENLVATGTIYARAGSFGKTNPFNISDNGLDGSTSSSAHTATITETNTIGLKNASTGAFNSSFQISVSQTGKTDALNDIYLSLGSAMLTIGYAYDVTTTVTNTNIVDRTGSESADSDADDTEAVGSGDTSSVVTTTTTTTTHYTGSVTVNLISAATDVSSRVAISLNNGLKTYTYTHTLTSGDILTYLRNTCKNNDSSISVVAGNLTITDAVVSPTYSYYYTSYTLVSHIGTDYLSYSNALTVRNGVVTLGSTTVTAQLTLNSNLSLAGQNAVILGTMASNDGWKIFGGGSNDAGYLEIATKDNGNEPIHFRQYSGNFATLTRTATILDGSGNTILPGTLKVNRIQITSGTYVAFGSPVVLEGVDTYLGWSSATAERRLRFLGTDAGTYRHDSYLYGGNTASPTAIGIYDGKNGLGVLVYNDVNKALSVAGVTHFYFKDWGGTTRKPIASTSADGKRVANIGSKSTGLTVYGQWGTAGAKFTAKTVKFDSSDIRLKENVKDCEITSALDVISNIRLHSFDWIDYDEDLERHQRIGFIADELEQVDSRFSYGGGYDEDGIMNVKGVDTFYMMGYVIKAIQELKAENDKLKLQISNMK